MKILVKLLLFILLLTNHNSLLSQRPAGPDGRSVVQRSSAAMGCQILTSEVTIRVTGLLQAPSMSQPMRLSISSQGNRRWRSELDGPKGHKVTIVNDGRGQIQHSDGHLTRLAVHNTSHQQPTHIPCLTSMSLPASAIDANYLRAEMASADTLDVIELVPAQRPPKRTAVDSLTVVVWISRNTGYPVKLQYFNADERNANDMATIEVEYSDYRIIQGVAIPFHQVMHQDDFMLDLRLDSVELNAPAADFNLR